jgi:hypothetical protein
MTVIPMGTDDQEISTTFGATRLSMLSRAAVRRRLFLPCHDNQESYISHQAEEISKRAATVATGQIKPRPEKFHRKTKKVPENSLKIETLRQSLFKISCISIYRPVNRLADQPFMSKGTGCQCIWFYLACTLV